MTLVIGGTGNVGQVVVPGLLAAGQQVRVLTRVRPLLANPSNSSQKA